MSFHKESLKILNYPPYTLILCREITIKYFINSTKKKKRMVQTILPIICGLEFENVFHTYIIPCVMGLFLV